MRRAFALLLAVAAPATAGEVQVRASGDRLDVVATQAAVSDVLTRLSQQTGMKVIYEGTAPRQLVTATLVGRTPVEATLGILEGLGLNFALRTDASGTRVETLLMWSGSTSPSGGPSGGPATPAVRPTGPVPAPMPLMRGRMQPPEGQADEPSADEEADPDEEQKTEPPAAQTQPVAPPTFSGPIPGPGQPGSPFGSQPGPLTFPTPPPIQPSPVPGTAPEKTPFPVPSPTAPPQPFRP